MKILTKELDGPLLDWAVAKSLGLSIKEDPLGFGNTSEGGFWIWDENAISSKYKYTKIGSSYSPSTKWEQGGPIIEQEGINLETIKDINKTYWYCNGDWKSLTPLVTAMRYYVGCYMGREVKVPSGVLQYDL